MATPDTFGGGTLNSWYMADSITGYSDGGLPTSWDDSSSVGHHLTGTWVGYPVYRATAAPGGKPCLDTVAAYGGFRGASASNFPAGNVSFFAMFSIATSPTGQQDILGGSTAGQAEFYLTSGNRVGLNRSGVSVVGVSALTFNLNIWTPVVITYAASTGDYKVRIGANSETVSGVSAATFTSTAYPQYGTFLSSLVYDFRGLMAECGCYSSTLSSSDVDTLVAYLSSKYSTQSLPRRPRIVHPMAVQRGTR